METCSLLDNENVYMEMKKKSNPYGDGKAAQRIVQHIKGT
jgi:UDP-N-acetylglucosamine 2-epimerase (non-hydrolysing)